MDKPESNAIGLLGIGAWLLGVIFIACGIGGIFNLPEPAKAEPYVAQETHAQCTPEYPRGFTFPRVIAKVTKQGKKTVITMVPNELPTCTGGDLQSTWRVCTPRRYV